MGFQDAATPRAALVYVVDGGGSAITTGLKGFLVVPFDGNIVGVELEADTTGNVKVDIWNDIYSNFPPTDADSITAGHEPTFTADKKYQDFTLTDWIKGVDYGDVLGFNIDTVATITRLTITLYVEKS